MSASIEEKAECVNTDLVARLRQLADVLEGEDVPPLGGWVTLCINGSIAISDTPFREMFAGQSVRGRRDGCLINVKAEAFGVTFNTMICDPDDSQVRDVIIQL